MRLKGRHWLLLWLALFLAVAALVTGRQSASYRLSRELVELKQEHAALDARRAELERRIRAGTGRQILTTRVAEALGLHSPADSEMTLFLTPTLPQEQR